MGFPAVSLVSVVSVLFFFVGSAVFCCLFLIL